MEGGLVNPRECGSCTMCCKIMEVNADDGTLLTRAFEWCRHCEIGRGCRVYAERPTACSEYRCAWLDGMFDDADRPDRSRLLVYTCPTTLVLPTGEQKPGPEQLVFKECAPGALNASRVQKMVRSAQAKHANIVGIRFEDGTRPAISKTPGS